MALELPKSELSRGVKEVTRWYRRTVAPAPTAGQLVNPGAAQQFQRGNRGSVTVLNDTAFVCDQINFAVCSSAVSSEAGKPCRCDTAIVCTFTMQVRHNPVGSFRLFLLPREWRLAAAHRLQPGIAASMRVGRASLGRRYARTEQEHCSYGASKRDLGCFRSRQVTVQCQHPPRKQPKEGFSHEPTPYVCCHPCLEHTGIIRNMA